MGKLGHGSITLTDLTETLPVFLMLESNLSNNIQKKSGSLYVPNFEEGEGVIITPSLFIGSEETSLNIEKYINSIYYKINSEEYHYKDSHEEFGVWVDNAGRLHININFPTSYEVEAFIDNFTNIEHGYSTPVKSRNKISIFILEENVPYTAIISSNRDYFDEDNISDIILTAQFYKGVDEINNASYEWQGLTNKENISGSEKQLRLSNSQINGTEVISCSMIDNDTGLSFVATKIIRDYSDEYRADLLPDSSLILTSNNPIVKLTARVWYRTNIVTGHNFDYEWQIIKKDGTTTTLENKEDYLIINTSLNFPTENFTIVCKITVDDKTTVSAYQNIIYSSTEYVVNIEPKQAWLKVNSEGNYDGTSSFDFKFQLLDNEKKPISLQGNDGIIPSENWEINKNEDGKWDYNLTFTLQEGMISSSEDFKIFEFQYQYLGKIFSEEIYIIKNYSGKDGSNGASYTIDLSNSFHSFAGEQAHAVAGQSTSCRIQAYYGDAPLEIESVTWDNIPTGLDIDYNNTNQTIIMTTKGNGDFLTKDGSIIFTIKVNKQDGIGTLSFIKTFNYSINYNNKTYYLSFGDTNTITYSPSTQTYNPSSIVIKSYSRNINGESYAYPEGIIYYSFDKETWIRLTEDYISNYSNIKNIHVRLYSSQMNPSQDLKDNSIYLLDEETIPVLTSLEGVEIGGDNLLRWTKNLPIETNKWSLYSVNANDADKIYQEPDGNFNSIVINESSPWGYVFSPKEKINSEYMDKTFCFSCYVYFNEVPKFISEPILSCQLRLYSNFSDSLYSDRKFHQRVAELSARTVDEDGRPYPQFIAKEEIVAGKWIKIYQTFTWNNFIPEKNLTIGVEDCKYFSLALYSGSTYHKRIVKIKKPKLEIGNFPTEWSASPYDVSYEDINGVNLINSSYSYLTTLNKEKNKITLASMLDPETDYILTWRGLDGIKSFCWTAESEEEEPAVLAFANIDTNQTEYVRIFNKSSFDRQWRLNFYFGIYNTSQKKIEYHDSTDSIIVSKIKLEKGVIPTPFNLTAEQIDLIKKQLDGDYISLNGNFIDLQDKFSNFEASSNATIDELNGSIAAVTSSVALNSEGLSAIQNSIVINSQDSSITIKTEGTTGSNIQSFSLVLTPTKLSFVNSQNEEHKTLASMSTDTLIINRSELIESRVSERFNIGGLDFKITESGVGLIWDLE